MSENTAYGGQAVIEGVMMRGPKFYAVACRRANNEITVRQESVDAILGRFQWLNKPFLRGTLAIIDAMALGMKALMFSANLAMEDVEKAEAEKPDKSGKPRKVKARKPGVQNINDIAVWGTMVFALALAVGLFFVLPHLITGLFQNTIKNPYWLNAIEGLVKFVIFIGYILAISMMKDIRRVFEFHGAEHRVINTYEAGLDLTAENIDKYGTIHQRCGTSFILIVLVVSIIVHMFLGWHSAWYLRVPIRLAFLPVIAGIAYETIRYAGKHKESRVLNALLSPGLLLQRVTTRPPSDDQVEVALAALNAVFEKERESAPQQETV